MEVRVEECRLQIMECRCEGLRLLNLQVEHGLRSEDYFVEVAHQRWSVEVDN